MLPVPFIGQLAGPPYPDGYSIRMQASPSPSARRINVNLQCGPNINPRDDVALNLAIDFDSRRLTMNNILGNQWGPEECDSSFFPFQRNIPFSTDITFGVGEFKILINGSHFLKFIHRLDPSRITHIAVDGDIVLHKLDYSGPNHGSFPAAQGVGFNVPPYAPTSSPYPPSGVPPYPTSGVTPYPTVPIPGTAPYPSPHTPYSQPRAPYPAQPYQAPLYPQQPGLPSAQPNAYPAQQPGMYPQQHGLYPQQPGVMGAHSPSAQHKQQHGIFDKIGGLTGGAVAGATGLAGLKHLKNQAKFSKKAQKKALKYGLPIAGVGLGAYALKKSHGFGMFKGSSSSSSSSSSDSD